MTQYTDNVLRIPRQISDLVPWNPTGIVIVPYLVYSCEVFFRDTLKILRPRRINFYKSCAYGTNCKLAADIFTMLSPIPDCIARIDVVLNFTPNRFEIPVVIHR